HRCRSTNSGATSRRNSALAVRGALALEVLERARNTFFECRKGLPTNVDRRPPGVERAALQFTRTRRRVLRRLSHTGEFGHHAVEPLHARLDAGADIEHQTTALPHCAHERVRDVVDVHIVASLRAVTEDDRTFAVEKLAGKDRNHTRFAVRILTRAV